MQKLQQLKLLVPDIMNESQTTKISEQKGQCMHITGADKLAFLFALVEVMVDCIMLINNISSLNASPNNIQCEL